MKVAVIGAGVAGHGAALALHGLPGVDVVLFEKDSRAGGHANTVLADVGGASVAVDTGFIVYNQDNYPHFTAMLSWLEVETAPSDMSFALSLDGGAYEWCGRHENAFNGLFAQRRNLLSPGHWLFLRDILRFQKQARADVAAETIGDGSLAAYLARHGFGAAVRDRYVVPMGAAIWSMTPGETLAFPAQAFLTFFDNHRLLQWDRPRWRTVAGGSRRYVSAVGQKLGAALRVGAGVAAVERGAQGVTVVDQNEVRHAFDAAIIATSATEALAMLAGASAAERAVLGACRVSDNIAVLHADARLMPKRRAAWASWNMGAVTGGAAAVTYWMNRLQPLETSTNLFVTLNPVIAPDPGKVIASIAYQHPLYDAPALAAQKRLPEIQGNGRVWFAGAWTAYGFHEDGLRSGLEAAAALGGVAPWLRGGAHV